MRLSVPVDCDWIVSPEYEAAAQRRKELMFPSKPSAALSEIRECIASSNLNFIVLSFFDGSVMRYCNNDVFNICSLVP